MRVVAQDFAQIAARAGARHPGHRRAAGRRCCATGSSDNTLITFTRAGWSNPAGIQRPAEQRVRYRFIDGSLVREHWLAVDPALNSEPRQRVVLTQVKSVEIRFLDPGHAQLAHRLAGAQRQRPGWAAQHRRALLHAPPRHRIHGGARGLGPRATPVRDPHVRHARQRGVALLVAIVIFAIATTVAAAITYNKAMAARRAAATFTLEQALQAGMAAEALAGIALEEDGEQQQDRRPPGLGAAAAAPWRSKAPASGSRRSSRT